MIPMMEKQGYDKEFSTAITMTSSVEGMLIPPSHNMVIYAMEAGGLSVKRCYPKGASFSIKNLARALWKSIWGLGTVIIVVYGVVSGKFTATESAAIACIYSLIVSMLLYRELKPRELGKVVANSVKTLSTVLILIAASGPFGFCITYLKIPQLVVAGILSLTSSKFLLLLILNCGIGLITPPVGGVLFIGSGLSGVPIERLFKHTLPLIVMMVVALPLITYVPAISLALPNFLGLLN